MAFFHKAVFIAVTAHKNQKDKLGKPYIDHPLRVGYHFYRQIYDLYGKENRDMEILASVGVLHDVLEDSDTTLLQIREHNFPEEVVEALGYISRCESENYWQYIRRVKLNPIAKSVKLIDLKDNTNLERVKWSFETDMDDFKRMKKYVLSYMYLSDRISDEEYKKVMKELGEI